MDERTREAYQRVYTDILNRDVGLFLGRYDAKHGNEHFMHGICTVMEFIANNADEKCLDEFDEIWYNNLEKSERKRGNK